MSKPYDELTFAEQRAHARLRLSDPGAPVVVATHDEALRVREANEQRLRADIRTEATLTRQELGKPYAGPSGPPGDCPAEGRSGPRRS